MWVATIAVIITLAIPTIAAETEPVTLDGREVFKVTDLPQFPARERVEWIESQLEEAVESGDPVDVEVRDRDGLPTIWVNESYLLTVTEEDVVSDWSTQRQARYWARKIQETLDRAREERSADFIKRMLVLAAAVLVAAFALHIALGRVWRQLLIPLIHQQRNPGDMETATGARVKEGLLHLTLAVVRLVLWVTTLFYISSLFPIARRWSYRIFEVAIASLTAPVLTVGQSSYSLIELLIPIAMLIGVVLLSNTLIDVLRSRVLDFTSLDRGAKEAIAVISKYAFIVIGSIVVLQLWGLDISSLTILASALGVGIGFGLQDIAKNLGSGLVLLFERPIQPGDFIEVGQHTGTVERIGSRSTTIRTLDQVSIIVPNSRFLENEVINWSHDNPVSRLRLPVGVAYGSDLQQVKAVLLDAARNHADVLKVPPPNVLFIGFGDSSLDFELLVWCSEPSRQYFITSDLYFEVEAGFNRVGVEIPFPQRDLHLRSGQFPIGLSPELEQLLLRLFGKN